MTGRPGLHLAARLHRHTSLLLTRSLNVAFGDVVALRHAVGSIAPPTLSLTTNFSWTLAGTLVYAGCQWGMLFVIAKLGSPQLVRRFTLGLAVTAPLMMLTNLQLRSVLATDATEEHPFGDYLALRLFTTGVALLAVAGIVIVARYQRQTALVIMAVGLMKGLESISDITLRITCSTVSGWIALRYR